MEMARGPKLIALLVAAVFAVALLVNRSNSISQRQDVSMASLHLDDGYLLYFKPTVENSAKTESEPVPGSDLLNKYALEYAGFVSHTLDGTISQQFDTLIYGFSFTLDYNKKVYMAIGSEKTESTSEQTTDDRLYKFLIKFKEEELANHGITMILERDKTMSTQGKKGV